MAIIACNISELTFPQRIVKGQTLITMGTNNPDVPGNAAALAVLVTAQAKLVATTQAAEEARDLARQRTHARDTAGEEWSAAVASLAGVTETATGGDPEKILTTGFDVKAEPTPPQPVAQVGNLRVSLTDMPGYSKLVWKRESNADAYVIQRCNDPITEAGWTNLSVVAEAKFTGNGVIPGQKIWYRVAGINKKGQGPWSEPVPRPVM